MDARLETHRAVAEAKDNLIAAVSHELRTPLTSISGFADILKEDETLSPTQHDMVEVIDAEASELARMIEDFLVAARFDHDIVELDAGDIEVMAAIIRPMVEAVEAAGREVEIDARELWVKGDRDRIVHIARNLLSNAMAHGGSNIRVVVLKEEGLGDARHRRRRPRHPLGCQRQPVRTVHQRRAAEPWSPAALAWALRSPA